MNYKVLKLFCRAEVLFLLVFSISITGCASHKKIDRLARKTECNKNLLFVLDESSNAVKIERKGEAIGNSKHPDYKKTFRKSIEELNRHTKANLLYKKPSGFSQDSVILVKVLIKEINWTFGFSSALMETELEYQVEKEKINITGKNKVFLAGTKSGNLFKSLKDGHYQLLTSICDQGNRRY